MSCVSKTVRQLQQFQDLAKKHDIHADLLEQIMYEWINTEGNENTFPSDAFIESHIKGTPMTNASQEQIELWNKRYKEPITFSTFNEAQNYQRLLTRYFSKESISLVPTYDGKYKVSVEKPVKEGTYQEHDRIGGLRDTNLKSLIQKDNVTVEDLLSIVSNSEYAGIVEFLRTKKNLFKGIEVHIDDWRGGRSALYDGRRAYYNADTNTIFINGDAEFVNSDSSSVILHEIMHSVTLARLHSDADAMKRFQAIMDEYVAKLPFSEGMYYNKNAGVLKYNNALEEFVADIWSKKSVIDNLKSIKSDSNTTLWDKIKTFFKGLIFGNVADDSLMAKASIELDKLLDTTPSDVRIKGNYYESFSYEFYSGGAVGADTEWGNQAQALGIKVKHYTTNDFDSLSKEWQAALDAEYKKVVASLGRNELSISTYAGKLVRRDMMQADKADAIFAIGNVVKSGEAGSKGYRNTTKHDIVDGGTGYAVERGIQRGIPVYVYDQNNSSWKMYNSNSGRFEVVEEPTLTPHAATIGTREIRQNSKDAIRSILSKSIQQTQQEEAEVYEEAYSKMEAENIVSDLIEFEGYSRDDITINFVKSDSEEIDDFYEIKIKKSALHQKEAKSQESVEEILVEQAEETEIDEPLSKEDQEFLDSQVSFNNQLSTLLNNDLGVTQTDIMKFAESVGYTMSDYLTWCQEGKMIENEFHKDYIFEVFPHLKNTPEERAKIQNMSRQQLAQYIGVQNLINVVKRALSEEGRDYSFDQLEAIYMFTDNWGAIMNLASMVFNNNEDFSILLKDGITSETLESTSIDIDNYNESNNEDEILENEGSQQGHWQVISRTIDIVSSIPQRVKGVLQQCKILDNDGNVVYNTWGHEERINLRNATKSILHWTNGSLNITDMIRKLEGQQDDNPWISQVLTLLNDTSGKYADFQSLFYSTFRKVSQKYSSVINEKGKMQNKSLNTDPALKRVTRGIKDLFRIGQHPLFKQNGIDSRNFNELKMESASLKSSLEDGNMAEANRALTRIINFLAGPSDIVSMITADIEKTITKEDAKSMLEKVEHIINTIEPKLNEASYDPFNFNDRSSISGDLNKLLKPLVKKLEETAVDSFYSDGNMYQTRVLPSWLTVFVETVNNPQAFNELMQNEYGITEWFRDQTQDFDNLDSWRSSWLRILNGRGITPEMRDRLFQHHVQLSYDGKQYMRDMNDMEYALSLISEYFSFKGSSDEMMQIANYVLPMMSNKPSNEFISFVRYSGNFSGSGVNWYDSAVQPSENTVIIDQSNTKLDGADLFSDNNKRIAWSIAKEADRNKGRKYRIGNITEGTKFTTSDVIRLFDSMKGFTNNVIPANILFNIDDILQTASPAKTEIVEGLKLTFDQEILRIQTVYDRHKLFDKKSQYWIKGWDDNGTKFNFLPELNDYLTEEFTGTNGSKRNTDFGKLLQKVLKGDKALTAEEKLRFNDRAKALILINMDRLASQQVEEWKRNGIFQACERVSNISDNVIQRENQLKEMFWNHRLAEINLLQLTIIDKAFYKNEEDLQKRMAQVHAPGVKGNKLATDYGNSDAHLSDGRVSDGYCRNIVLTDFEGIKSNIVMNVREVFDRKLKTMQEGSAQYIAASEAYNAIVKSFEESINVADAQAYSALTATRKKKLIFGKWDKHYEDVFNRIQNGTYTYDDLNFAIQPEKPFLYGHTMESTRVESQISKMPIPVQNKNSEYLIMLADAILQNEKTGRPNMLKVLNRIMEESAWTGRTYNPDGTIKTKGTYNGKGIDVVQFESAVKSGLEGKIDLRSFMESQNGEQEAYDYIRGMIYQSTDNGVLIDRPEAYNDASVKALDFDSYSIQQEVPEHFLNHEQSHGSQERVIIPSDLENFDSEGNEVFYTYKDNGKEVSQKAEEFRKEYEETISKNIQYSINDLRQQLGLAIDGKSKGRKQKNIALAKLLQREILSNISRYGVDLLQSCMLDENGEFVIPLGDPIQGKRVEQLINSIIKNRVNKQVVSGGPVVQVSNWGTSRELSIVFKDKKGGLLQTYKQYMESHEGATDEQYKTYIKENQGGMAYMEVFAPIFDERLLEFADEKGNIDISKIEAMNPEILEMIGYRIPTEDKYSIIPMKIVGFLPREAGAGIMMANDVTLLTGSDFDVDKMFLMRKSFDWKDNTDQIRTKVLSVAFTEMKEGNSMKQISDVVDQFLTNPEAMKDVDELHRKMYNAYKAERKISGVIMPKSGKQYLNNKVFNMSYSVLTNETTLDKMLNPGGFDRQKVMGYKIEAFRISGKSWEELSKMSWKELQKTVQTPKDLSLIGTQIQFYKQNSAAATALGMAAVQKSAHALLESDGYKINVSKVCNLVRTPSAGELREIGYDVDDVEYNRMVELIGEGNMSENELIQKFGDLYQWYKEGVDGQFAIAGKVFSGLMEFDAKYDDTGVTMIGRTLGELVAMFADAVKDPVANLMNVNNTTMPVFTTLIRFGMSFEDAALFMSQKVIKDMLSELGAINAGGRKKGKKREKKTTFERLLANEVKKLRTMLNISQDSRLNYEELTRQELIDGIKESKPTVIYKVMNNYLRIAQMNKAIKGATFLTRFNSMSGAVGPLIIDNLMMEYKMNSQDNDLIDANGNVVPTHTILDKHPIINGFSQSLYISQELFKGMPIASQYFKHSIDSQPELMRNKIMSSRSLLNSYARFFNSYLMVSSGIINPNSDRGLEYFITKFPQEFFASDPKTKYPDNPFIQAMRLSAEENGDNSVRQVIRIDHTGLDEVEKSKLRSGWADLHKKDPQLAFDLFQYAFYKGGIDFNPKSFMALLPVQLRKMYYQYDNGTKMVFRNFERTDEQLIFNQFLRNNSDNYSLFPSPQDIAMVEVGNGVFKVLNADKIGFENTPSFAHNDKLYIFAGTQNGIPYYKEYTALGNNGEYMEMSLNPIESAMNDSPLTTFEQQSDVKDLEEQDEPLTTSEKIQSLNAATQWYNTVEGKQAIDTQSSREQKMREFEKHLAEEGIKFDKGVIEGTLIKLNIC